MKNLGGIMKKIAVFCIVAVVIVAFIVTSVPTALG